MEYAEITVKEELDELMRTIVSFPKTSAPDLTFIKTTPVGSLKGHILTDAVYFYLCLSKNDTIRINTAPHNYYVMGFRRESMDEIDYLIQTNFRMAPADDHKLKNGVVLPITNPSDSYMYRVEHTEILNVRTGHIFSICNSKANTMRTFGFNGWNLDKLMLAGGMVGNWVMYKNRIDGKSWESIVGFKPIRVKSVTSAEWYNYDTERHPVYMKSFVFIKGKVKILTSTPSDFSNITGVPSNLVLNLFSRGGDGLVGGYRLALETDDL